MIDGTDGSETHDRPGSDSLWARTARSLWDADGLATLLTCATEAIAVLDGSGEVRFANPAAQQLLGYEPGALLGTDAFSLIHDDDRDAALGVFADVVARPGSDARITIRLVDADHEVRHVEVAARNLLEDETVVGIVLNIRDITEVVTAREAEAASERRFRELAATAPDLIFRYRVAPPAGFEYLNAATETLTGYTAQELLADPGLIGDLVDQSVLDELAMRDVENLQREAIEFELRRADGSTRWAQLRLTLHTDDRGQVTLADGIVRDLSIRYAAEQELTYKALHDDLSGLPNRALFHDRLETALRNADRNPTSPAVLFCDIDHFKAVNDTYGHAVGDQVLRVTGERLASTIRAGDTAARLGGDEFLVMCNDLSDGTELDDLCDRLRDAVNQPIDVGHARLSVSVSIGSAWATANSTAEDLLHTADQAMYQEKAKVHRRTAD